MQTLESFLPHSAFIYNTILVILLPPPRPMMNSLTTRSGVKGKNEVEGTAVEGSRSLEAEFMPAVSGGSYGAVQR
jgi:hypothetical protein